MHSPDQWQVVVGDAADEGWQRHDAQATESVVGVADLGERGRAEGPAVAAGQLGETRSLLEGGRTANPCGAATDRAADGTGNGAFQQRLLPTAAVGDAKGVVDEELAHSLRRTYCRAYGGSDPCAGRQARRNAAGGGGSRRRRCRLGYIAPIALLTAGYALFQVANNTMLMKDLFPERRGLIAGMVNLARNLGAITGASAMGALFYLASQQVAGTAAAAAVDGMRVTYGVAALLALAALLIAFGGRRRMLRYDAR